MFRETRRINKGDVVILNGELEDLLDRLEIHVLDLNDDGRVDEAERAVGQIGILGLIPSDLCLRFRVIDTPRPGLLLVSPIGTDCHRKIELEIPVGYVI
jgi:hypothetical protein